MYNRFLALESEPLSFLAKHNIDPESGEIDYNPVLNLSWRLDPESSPE